MKIGLLTKAILAKEANQIAEYKERLNLIITEEIAERRIHSKEELMIKSLDEKIRARESSWVQEVYKCDKDRNEQETFEKSTHLLVESKEHYEFFIEVNESEKTAKIISAEKGTGEKYKVTYNPNGAEGEEETIEVKAKFTTMTKPCTYKKESYYFAGWCENANGEGEKYLENTPYKPTKNVTLYAIWELNVAKITFNKNDGTNEIQEVTVTKGEDTKISSNSFIRDGYEFKNWNTKADGTGDTVADGATVNYKEDVILYAIWERLIVVTFDGNGHTSGTMESEKVRKGNNLLLPENGFTKDGYTFIEWNTKADGTGVKYNDKATINNVTSDINLYAIWKMVVSASSTDNSSLYGATVTGYELKTVNGVNYNEAVANWKILYIDENNIYLIADYFIHKNYCPGSKNNAISPYSNHSLRLTNVVKDYSGTANITNSKIQALNSEYFKYLSANNKTNTGDNAKAVSYLLDTNVWSVYKGDRAEYAIGAPTIELLIKSYNQKYKTNYSVSVTHEYGYTLNGTISFSTTDTLYVTNNRPTGEYTYSYFIASPSYFVQSGAPRNTDVMDVYGDGTVMSTGIANRGANSIWSVGIRPVVCLEKNTKLEKISEGNYKIVK